MDLKIRFSGLCNFVPMYSGNEIKKVWVVLVNAQDPDNIPGGKVVGEELVAFSHWAFVRFPLEYVAPGAPPDSFGLWPLDLSDVQILDGNGAPLVESNLVTYKPRLADDHVPGDEEESKSFHWLAEMGMAEPSHGRIDGDCINSDVSKVPNDIVSARVGIVGGVLSSSAIVSKPGAPGAPIIWDFNPPDPAVYSQALAEEISLDAKIATNSVKLLRTNRDTGDMQELILSQVGGKIDISIVNLEPESVLGVGERKRSNRIEEFRWFYMLSVNGDNPPYPIPVTDPGLGGNPYCPMAKSES